MKSEEKDQTMNLFSRLPPCNHWLCQNVLWVAI
jgi:hypothetical protein